MDVLFGPRGLVADRVERATTRLRRLRGLLGRRRLGPGEALILTPCSQVHTIGLRFPIDAVFCDSELRVLRVSTLAPRRLSPLVRGAACCVELAAGRAGEAGIEPGVHLEVRRVSGAHSKRGGPGGRSAPGTTEAGP